MTPAGSRGRRVAVTGIGVVSPLGCDAAQFWDGMVDGRCGIAENAYMADRLPGVKSVAYVQGYNSEDHFEPARAGKLAAFSQYAVVAALEAVRDAGLELPLVDGARVSVVVGSSSGGMDVQEEGYRRLFERGLSSISPTAIMRGMHNAPTSAISIELGAKGPAFCTSTACSSSTHGIALAYWMVRSGVCDTAICGGADSVRNYGMLKAWEAMRVLSPDLCRPFSAERNGCVLGEGAGIVVLEALDRARERGARVYCEVIGAGMSADAHDLVMPNVEGPSLAMENALSDAGIAPEDVDHINAHGTGTRLNDLVEARAINQVFGSHAPAITVSATKSMHGHGLGATGGIEFAALCLAAYHQVAPPTLNVGSLDPECAISFAPEKGLARPIRAAMSNSLAFGGLNASILVAQA